jgi:hypothetical protein
MSVADNIQLGVDDAIVFGSKSEQLNRYAGG